MNQAVFSYQGDKVWKFQEVLFIQNRYTYVIFAAQQAQSFDDMYEAISFVSNMLGKRAVFELGQEERYDY